MGCGISSLPPLEPSREKEVLPALISTGLNQKFHETLANVKSRSPSIHSNYHQSDSLSLTSSIIPQDIEVNDNRKFSFILLDPSNGRSKIESVSDAESGIELSEQKLGDLFPDNEEIHSMAKIMGDGEVEMNPELMNEAERVPVEEPVMESRANEKAEDNKVEPVSETSEIAEESLKPAVADTTEPPSLMASEEKESEAPIAPSPAVESESPKQEEDSKETAQQTSPTEEVASQQKDAPAAEPQLSNLTIDSDSPSGTNIQETEEANPSGSPHTEEAALNNENLQTPSQDPEN